MARLRYDGLTATLDATGLPATGTTTIGFTAALTSMAGAVPTISGGDYIPLVIGSEIVYLTAYTSGATSGAITRAQESTTAAVHAGGAAVIHGPTVLDFAPGGDSTWTAPTFQNSWVNFGAPYANAGYRKDSHGRVNLRGLIKSGTLGSAAFTLPVGYRPPADMIVACISNDAFGELIITSAGLVKPTSPSSTSWVSLTGVAFFTD